ncbi:protein SIEVE ELEMENT OCCLUSION C isoform X2 [Jatropha curcas]|uniref:protein SIEVE ELEMENT OCCLUSION C isoform X2 n=1 Tax=Jatropha curcas TaxID=180498 RepID=UPI0009D704EB|nr:protein SIEVE ELEMENT OCCLUSION C isoform X2 [Jatropha curcas]
MNFFGNDRFSRCSSSTSLEEEILINKILLTHDPDDRRVDSELLLCAMENVLSYTATSEVSSFHIDANAKNDISNIKIVGAEESLAQIICKISHEMLVRSPREGDLHTRTMVLFDLLGNYRWDAKVVLVLAAFATSYGEFWLIMQLYPINPLAASVAMLKQLPNDLRMLKPRFKALSSLVKTMLDVTKCIIKFEGLPLKHVKLDDGSMAIAKSYIYIAAYWVTRSALACSSQITDLKAMKPEQVCSNSTAIAAWQLSSLVYRLSGIYTRLSRQVDLCHQQIETKLYQKLLNLFQEVHANNQEVLGMLLALRNDLPLKDTSAQAKLGVSELKDKVVVLLVSKPELLPLDAVLLLVHQIYNHAHPKKLHESYEIVWVPISFSDTWTDAEAERFNLLSNSLPWYSVQWPWLLNAAVVNYIKQAWNFTGDPIMVVLDSQGIVINSNAIDMALIWGAKAYPFSSSREKQLWEEESWTIQFVVDEIDPLLTRWVEEDRNICIYGSENLDWIREFNSKLKKIKSDGVQIELVYVGKRHLTENVRSILGVINEEMHNNLFSFTKLHFFWLRLESMRRSILRLGQSISSDHIQKELSSLLDSTNEGWAVIGRGSTKDIVKLQETKALECLNKFSELGENEMKLGFLGALRTTLEPPPPPRPCNHTNVIPYAERLADRIVVCEKCKRIMEEYVLYE